MGELRSSSQGTPTGILEWICPRIPKRGGSRIPAGWGWFGLHYERGDGASVRQKFG